MQNLLKASKGVLIITSKNAEKDRDEIIKELYELGFEVGFKGHSEIGWVLREYNDLIKKAQKNGIKSPDSHYEQGKVKGKTARDKGDDVQKSAQKAEVLAKRVDVSDIGAGYYDDIVENETNTPMKKPTLNELPEFIKKIRSSEIPGLLEGSKQSKRKRTESKS